MNDMLSIFEIFEQRGIPHNIKLEEFLDEYFHFLPALDPKILDQMSAEEICEHHEFWNNESYMPIKFLLENNKISIDGFNTVMRKEYYYTNATDEKMQNMYLLLENYILENNVDITGYFKDDYVYEQMEDILRYKIRINTDAYLNNLNLAEALENSDSIAVLLFGFKDTDLPTRRTRMMEYICENFDIISKKFICGTNTYKASPSLYIRDNCEFIGNPLYEVASYIDNNYGLLDDRFKNPELIETYLLGLLKESNIDKAKDIMNLIEGVYPNIYDRISKDKRYRDNFLINQSLELEGITVEKMYAFLDICTEEDRRKVTKNLDYYKAVNNGDEFNYKYSEHKFFNEYTKEFLEYQLDESIRLFNLKNEFKLKGEKEPITSHWRWNDYTQTIMRDVIHLCVNKNEWIDLIEKALSCTMYQEYLMWYVEANGDLSVLNYINMYQPQLINKMNHKDLIQKIIVREFNKNTFGW